MNAREYWMISFWTVAQFELQSKEFDTIMDAVDWFDLYDDAINDGKIVMKHEHAIFCKEI